VGHLYQSLWLLLTLLLSVIPDLWACDNPFGWIKEDKNRACTGSCSSQDLFLRGIHSDFFEKKMRPLD
jgi:hypothetical protein